jgi:hypothetical protein
VAGYKQLRVKMAEKPTNEKLWSMVVFQAKTKYHPYPSPGASNWVHKKYIEMGGKFEDSASVANRKEAMKRLWKKKLEEKRQAAEKEHKDKKSDK